MFRFATLLAMGMAVALADDTAQSIAAMESIMRSASQNIHASPASDNSRAFNVLKEMESVPRPFLRSGCASGNCATAFLETGTKPFETNKVNFFVEADALKENLMAMLNFEKSRLAQLHKTPKASMFLRLKDMPNGSKMRNMLATTAEMRPSAMTVNIVESANGPVSADVVH